MPTHLKVVLAVLLGIGGCDDELVRGLRGPRATALDSLVSSPAANQDGGAPLAPATREDGAPSSLPRSDAGKAPPSTKPDAGSPTSPPKSTDSWTLGQVPFAPTSSWNTPIAAGATYTKLAWPASTGSNYWVNWDAYSPAVHFSQPTDPLVQVAIPDTWGWPAGDIPVRLADGVSGATGTDGEIIIIDGTTVHNFWRFQRTGTNTATAEAYGRADVVKDSGWGSKSPLHSAGIVATGSSQFAGLLVQAETDAGDINHALQLALDGALQQPGFTGEALSGDGSSSNGIAQEGQRLAIPPGVAMPSGLSPLGQKVFRAMQKYGVFDIDVSGGSTILRAQANAYDSATINSLTRDVKALIPLLQAVK